MKVSLNLAQDYSNVDLKSIPRDELLKSIGTQLGAIEEVSDWAPRYEGIVVAEIMSCEKHPNADKLKVCLIDDGGKVKGVNRDAKGLVQVVCGAPNARVKLIVAWIPPGVVVPATIGDDPLKLEVREIRGVKSNGMLASPSELGISDDHDGILELSDESVGRKLKKGEAFSALRLDDLIINCENKMFTHRPDCFGNLGVARELAGISGKKFVSPDWYLKAPKFSASSKLPFRVKVESKLVSRFMAVAMENVSVSKSPFWLQTTLAKVGIKPINNVVDITNYVMHLTGQPIHAFDYDKLKKRSGVGVVIGPRKAKKDEKITLLGGKEVTLNEEDIVIATDKKAVALAGIMGGQDTEVDFATKRIVLECATFDMFAVRRSSMRHGLFTEASTRYTKGQSPLQNDRVLAYCMKTISDLAGGVQASDVKDERSILKKPDVVKVSVDFINSRLGSDLKSQDIVRLLENVEFDVTSNSGNLRVLPPFWRTDVEIKEDIVEEVGRLYGYDKLPVNLPDRSAKPTKRDELLDLKQSLRTKLSAAGANEILTYSFVHGDLMKSSGIDPDKWAYHLRNALSPDLQYYRTSLISSVLEKVYPNIRSDRVRSSDDNDFAIFEIGKAHVKGHDNAEKLPGEFERLALVFSADQKTAKRKYHGSAYYMAEQYLNVLLGDRATLVPLTNNAYPITSVYELNRSAMVMAGKEVFGVIGEFNEATKKALKLPDYTAGFELDIELYNKFIGDRARKYSPLSVFPKTQQDITFKVKAGLPAQELVALVWDELQKQSVEHGYIPVFTYRDIYQAEDDTKHKNITLRLWLSHSSRTLTTEEVNILLNIIAKRANEKLSATRI
ncbi:MAG: phenylalanine--tRNA ligase subunit beta [Patescibacteria group bacterium]